MAEQVISLPWGADRINIRIPARWKVNGILEPTALPPVEDTQKEISRALAEPVGMDRLEDWVKPGQKIVVVIDDISRPTPVNIIFPILFANLKKAGVNAEQITLIPALGVHRGMDESEIIKRIGMETLQGMKWENPDADDQEKQSFLGTTSRGTPVWINRTTAESDVIISIGCIEPHIIASFGGGYKNLLPGIAGRVSIAHNHALNCQPGTFNMVGQPIDQNPMRQDLEEAGKMLKPKVFIINAILNNLQQMVKVVSGDPIAAHREGVRISASLYGVNVIQKADIVISDSHPMNSDLRQGVKALANTIRALKKGGILITVVRAEEGVGVFGLANKKLPLGKKALKFLAPVILPLVAKLKLKGMGEEDRFFLYFALQAMRMGTLLMYAPTIPQTIHENLPFVTFVPSLEKAIEIAKIQFPGNADVLVFPNGGITYPIIG
jgi:nickel-dependent lactate racemase